MNSREVQRLTEFDQFFFRKSPSTLEELMTGAVRRLRPNLQCRALAVGIDLSVLGYGDNVAVDGLFFQDVMDDTHVVDPVFIAGLPSDEVEVTEQ